MIKAVVKGMAYGQLTIFGLTDENWRRMRELGQPIYIDGADVGLEGRIAIMAGSDERTIEADVRHALDQAQEKRDG